MIGGDLALKSPALVVRGDIGERGPSGPAIVVAMGIKPGF